MLPGKFVGGSAHGRPVPQAAVKQNLWQVYVPEEGFGEIPEVHPRAGEDTRATEQKVVYRRVLIYYPRGAREPRGEAWFAAPGVLDDDVVHYVHTGQLRTAGFPQKYTKNTPSFHQKPRGASK